MHSSSWYGTQHKTWTVAGLVASAGILAASLGYMAEAHAEPGCTASGLSSALGTVATQTGGWLSTHPEAEQVINTADEGDIQNYFATHQAEWSELQGSPAPCATCATAARNMCPPATLPGCMTPWRADGHHDQGAVRARQTRPLVCALPRRLAPASPRRLGRR